MGCKTATSFKPGQSGNPDGRPKGAKNKRTKYQKMLEDGAEDAIKQVVKKAKDGDMTAIRLIVERVSPPVKARGEPLSLVITGDTFEEQAQAVFDALNDGKLSSEELTAVMGAIIQRAKLAEIDELERRIAALEEVKK